MAPGNLSLIVNWRALVKGSLLLITVFSSSVASTAPKELDKIVVWGASPTHRVVGRSSIAPIMETTLQYRVRYDDLDLATNDGADVLRKRVTGAANRACADLDRMYFSWSRDVSCIRKAERSARSQVEDAIKQAQHGR